jgi:DNA-binding NarL/FixJ family response regulator
MPPIRILLVDSNVSFTRTTKEFIERQFQGEPRVTVLDPARSGFEALTRIGVELPDLILIDLDMPDMSGVDAIRLIRSRGQLPEVVILSFCEEGELRIAASYAGADGYLNKSDLVEQLPDLIQMLLNRCLQ